MGWRRGRFPHFAHLNLLCTRRHLDDTVEFFKQTFGPMGEKYELGRLCEEYYPNNATNRQPPWEDDEDTPHDANHAEDWRNHCQRDLNIVNKGSSQAKDGKWQPPTGNTVRKDLENWIKEALLSEPPDAIRYRFQKEGSVFRAKRRWVIKPNGREYWKIKVKGPGF